MTATTAAGLEPGSPFGHSIAAMVMYLYYAHAIGMERLTQLMNKLFGLSISEGAISNILVRARQSLLNATATIETVVLASPMACSDEISVRVKSKTWWVWVLIGTLAVLHVIQPSPGKALVIALFGAIHPEVWASDMLGSQRSHRVLWQACLAHLLRDSKYAIAMRRYCVQRAVPAVAVARHRNWAVPRTNNVSERHLRPSVLFRKVTNGSAASEAPKPTAFRFVVSMAKANRASVMVASRCRPNEPRSHYPGMG